MRGARAPKKPRSASPEGRGSAWKRARIRGRARAPAGPAPTPAQHDGHSRQRREPATPRRAAGAVAQWQPPPAMKRSMPIGVVPASPARRPGAASVTSRRPRAGVVGESGVARRVRGRVAGAGVRRPRRAPPPSAPPSASAPPPSVDPSVPPSAPPSVGGRGVAAADRRRSWTSRSARSGSVAARAAAAGDAADGGRVAHAAGGGAAAVGVRRAAAAAVGQALAPGQLGAARRRSSAGAHSTHVCVVGSQTSGASQSVSKRHCTQRRRRRR